MIVSQLNAYNSLSLKSQKPWLNEGLAIIIFYIKAEAIVPEGCEIIGDFRKGCNHAIIIIIASLLTLQFFLYLLPIAQLFNYLIMVV